MTGAGGSGPITGSAGGKSGKSRIGDCGKSRGFQSVFPLIYPLEDCCGILCMKQLDSHSYLSNAFGLPWSVFALYNIIYNNYSYYMIIYKNNIQYKKIKIKNPGCANPVFCCAKIHSCSSTAFWAWLSKDNKKDYNFCSFFKNFHFAM